MAGVKLRSDENYRSVSLSNNISILHKRTCQSEVNPSTQSLKGTDRQTKQRDVQSSFRTA